MEIWLNWQMQDLPKPESGASPLKISPRKQRKRSSTETVQQNQSRVLPSEKFPRTHIVTAEWKFLRLTAQEPQHFSSKRDAC